MKRISDLGEKIYLLVYGKPRYKLEISDKLYGRECKAIYPEIKKLEKMKWIRQIEYKNPNPNEDPNPKSGKRANRRQYYYANAKPLFDSMRQDLKDTQGKLSTIKKKLDIELTDTEKKKLLHLIDSKVFRAFVGDLVNKVERIDGLDHPSFCFFMVKNYFSSYCAFTLWFEIFYIYQMTRESEFEKTCREINKKYGALTNFADISEGVLSLGFHMIKKLTCLNCGTSSTLLSYLDRAVHVLGEIGDSISILESNPLSNFPPVDDFFDFCMFKRSYKEYKSLVSL